MNEHPKFPASLPIQHPEVTASSSDQAYNDACAKMAAGFTGMRSICDSDVALYRAALRAEYAADQRAAVLRRRFCEYVSRLPKLTPNMRHVAKEIAQMAEIVEDGTLEATFTFAALERATGLDAYSTIRNAICDPGGLELEGLLTMHERATGGGQVWRATLVIGALDADLPERAVDAFAAKVERTYAASKG